MSDRTGGQLDGADDDAFVVGLKELPDDPPLLRHRHVFFGHGFTGQQGGTELLEGSTTPSLHRAVEDVERLLELLGNHGINYEFTRGGNIK